MSNFIIRRPMLPFRCPCSKLILFLSRWLRWWGLKGSPPEADL